MNGFHKTLKGSRIAIALGIGVGLTVISLPSQAQLSGTSSSSLSPNDRETEEINNFLNGTGDGSAGSLFSVINRLQSLSGRSGQDFADEQDENINSAVQDFRKKQQEKLQNQGSSLTPQNTPGSTPPAP